MAEIGYTRAIFGSGYRVWLMAGLEILVVGTISLIPLLGAALREILPPESKIFLGDAFEKAFLSGQLLFYAIGLIATIVWQSNKDLNHFYPLRALFNLYSFTGIVVCSIVIGHDPTLTSTNQNFLATFSVALFISAIFLYALICVISQVHVNVGKRLAERDAALMNDVRKSRGIE